MSPLVMMLLPGWINFLAAYVYYMEDGGFTGDIKKIILNEQFSGQGCESYKAGILFGRFIYDRKRVRIPH